MSNDEQNHENDASMVKEGVVRKGKTPSVVSGSESARVKRGQAYAKGEKEVDSVEDLANEFDR